MKTQSKSLTLRITEVKEYANFYELRYSRRYRMANSRGYNWIRGWERFIFDNGNISWRSEEDLQDLLRKVAMSKKSLHEYILQSI
jgi:hypothetical protein